MNQSKYLKNLSKNDMRLIAKMRGINVKKSASKIELFRILRKEDKITYKESIIQDIRNKLSENGSKLIKKGLYYVEKMKELTESQVKIIKEKLIKFQNELIRKNRIKKKDEGEDEGVKDIRYLFNEYEDVDEDKTTYKESPFKSIIQDIKRGLYYVEKMNNQHQISKTSKKN